MAMVRDESKIVLQLGVPETEQTIRVCTLSGLLVEELNLANVSYHTDSLHRRIYEIGWTGDDFLVVVDEIGRALVFRDVGSGQAQSSAFTLGPACEEEGLAETIIASSGIYFRTKENRFWCIKDLASWVPLPLAGPEDEGIFHCFDPIPSVDGAVEIVAGINSDLFIIDVRQSIKFAAGMGPFVKLAVSPNGLMIAAASANDIIFVFQNENIIFQLPLEDAMAHFHQENLEDSAAFVIPSGIPIDLKWCGADAIVACWQDLPNMLIITMDGTYEWIHVGVIRGISSEVDGVCLLSQERVQLCRIVPPAAASVLEPGSVSPAAILHDSRKLLGQEDVRASAEILDIIENDDIEKAVQDCLYSAGFTLDPHTQQSLVKAGCFGMAFSPLSSKDGKHSVKRGSIVVDLARSLRILNALRDPAVGLPLTLVQYGYLGLPRITKRLCHLGQFSLALKICESVDHPVESVLLAWSKRKISSCVVGCTDEELYSALRKNLDSYPAIPWSIIAEHALHCGRHHLALKLVELDVSIKMQIPLLLNTGKSQAAMEQALKEGDPDTIFQVVHYAKACEDELIRLSTGEDRSASFILLAYLNRHSPDQLVDLVSRLGDNHFSALYHMRELQRDLTGPSPLWNTDKNHLAICENILREGKLLANACQAAEHLEHLQRELEKKSGREGFVGLSVANTVSKCFTFGLKDDAKKLAKEFKMTDRQYQLLHLDAISKAQDWVAVSHLFASKVDKKSVFRMDDVIDAAIKYRAPMDMIQTWIDEQRPGAHTYI